MYKIQVAVEIFRNRDEPRTIWVDIYSRESYDSGKVDSRLKNLMKKYPEDVFRYEKSRGSWSTATRTHEFWRGGEQLTECPQIQWTHKVDELRVPSIGAREVQEATAEGDVSYLDRLLPKWIDNMRTTEVGVAEYARKKKGWGWKHLYRVTVLSDQTFTYFKGSVKLSEQERTEADVERIFQSSKDRLAQCQNQIADASGYYGDFRSYIVGKDSLHPLFHHFEYFQKWLSGINEPHLSYIQPIIDEMERQHKRYVADNGEWE